MTMSGGNDRRGNGHQLGTANFAQHLQRIGDAGDAGDRQLHRLTLACQALVIDTGSTPDPRSDLTTGEGGNDCRGDGGVADAHLAEHEQVGVQPFHRLPTSSKRSTDIAGSTRMSPVGRPTPTSIASTVAPATAAKALMVDFPDRYAPSIAPVTSTGYLLTPAAATP